MDVFSTVTTVVSLAQKAWRLYCSCKAAPGSFNGISHEVLSLHAVLKEVEEVFAGDDLPESRLNTLYTITQGCQTLLRDLEAHLQHYESLGSKNKRTWDRLQWNSGELAEYRSRLTSNITLMNTFISTSQLFVIRRLNEYAEDCRNGHHEPSVISTHTIDSISKEDRETWRQIRKELEDIGITVTAFEANKSFILDWFHQAQAKGELEERSSSPSPSSVMSTETATLAMDSEDFVKSDLDSTHSMLALLSHKRDLELPQYPDQKSHERSSTPTKRNPFRQATVDLLSPGSPNPSFVLHVVALLDYDGRPGYPTLSFRVGDVLTVADAAGAWWLARNTSGENGLIPSNYVLLPNSSSIYNTTQEVGFVLPSERQASENLFAAIRSCDIGKVLEALAEGARVKSKGYADESPLQVAARLQQVDICRILLVADTDFDFPPAAGPSARRGNDAKKIALVHAVMKNNMDLARLLIDYGAIDNTRPSTGWPPLHYATSASNIEMIRLLLRNGARIAAQDSSGSTALHIASSYYQYKTGEAEFPFQTIKDIVVLLRSAMTTEQVNLKNNVGLTAREIGLQSAGMGMQQLWKDWEVDENVQASRLDWIELMEDDPTKREKIVSTRQMAGPREEHGRWTQLDPRLPL